MYCIKQSKAVDRGDKRTRRLRVRVLAHRENYRRLRVRVSTLQEKARRCRCLSPALRKPLPRTSARSLVRGSRLIGGHPCPRSMEQGTRTRMSTDGPWASKITVLTTQNMYKKNNVQPKFPRYFVEAIIFSALDNVQPKFPRYFVEAFIFSALDNAQP